MCVSLCRRRWLFTFHRESCVFNIFEFHVKCKYVINVICIFFQNIALSRAPIPKQIEKAVPSYIYFYIFICILMGGKNNYIKSTCHDWFDFPCLYLGMSCRWGLFVPIELACACVVCCLFVSVDCCCQVAVMNLPAGWPLTRIRAYGWGNNGEAVEAEEGAPWKELGWSDGIDWRKEGLGATRLMSVMSDIVRQVWAFL